MRHHRRHAVLLSRSGCGLRCGNIEQALHQAGKGYVLSVKGDRCSGSRRDKPVVAGTAVQIASDLDPGAWHRLSAGNGTKGGQASRLGYFKLADDDLSDSWTRSLLIRRHVADGELAFFTTWCPVGTGIEALVGVEGHRWAIEDNFAKAGASPN